MNGEEIDDGQARFLGYSYIYSKTDIHVIDVAVRGRTPPKWLDLDITSLSGEIKIQSHPCDSAIETAPTTRFNRLLKHLPTRNAGTR